MVLSPIGCACVEHRESCRNRRWGKIGGKVGIVGIGQLGNTYLALIDPRRLPATIGRDFDVEDDNTKETRARRRSEGAAKVDAYWQRVRAEEVARMIDFLQTRLTLLARAMKEGAAEVDAFWQCVRGGGRIALLPSPSVLRVRVQ
jgi:hypothetical protein